MIERLQLFDIIYALAAKDGREGVLFGKSVSAAREAFSRSLACDAFPELWFEVPLAGDPWFDFHALTAREDLACDMAFVPEVTGGYPAVFEWFARQRRSARQLALSWDTGSGSAETPAVQLLVRADDPDLTCGFLESAGRPDAVGAYRAFWERIPREWFACYSGVFPARPGHNLRVECIPSFSLQRAYADDADLLANHLRQAGLESCDEALVERCQLMARAPFQLEFQFDVEPGGLAGAVFGASVRFARPPGEGKWKPFDCGGAAGDLMRQVEAWGLADSRWRELSNTMFAMRVGFEGESCVVFCYPAFLKLRWRGAEPLDAKAYLIAGVQGWDAAFEGGLR